jgi:hypothetical protein
MPDCFHVTKLWRKSGNRADDQQRPDAAQHHRADRPESRSRYTGLKTA